MKEFSFPSHGAGTIRAYRWEPEGAPVAVLQIVHGIAEHMLRYDEFARWLNERGVLIVAEDHMGHGKSEGSGAPLYFAGGWFCAVDDSFELLRRTQAEFPDTPYFILGHSMGSFLTRSLLIRYPKTRLAGAVICGTAWQLEPVLLAGRALTALAALGGDKRHSRFLHRLMFGAYNAEFPDAKTENDWVCSDPEVVARYTADPLCGGRETVGLARAMLGGIAFNQKRKNLARMNPELPVLFIAGQSDPVGNMGKGVVRAADEFRKAGVRRVDCKLYPGRHEILNEPNRLEVYRDVWNFMAAAGNLVTDL